MGPRQVPLASRGVGCPCCSGHAGVLRHPKPPGSPHRWHCCSQPRSAALLCFRGILGILGRCRETFLERTGWKRVFQGNNCFHAWTAEARTEGNGIWRLFPSRFCSSRGFRLKRYAPSASLFVCGGERRMRSPFLPSQPSPKLVFHSFIVSAGTPQKYDPTFKGPIYDR